MSTGAIDTALIHGTGKLTFSQFTEIDFGNIPITHWSGPSGGNFGGDVSCDSLTAEEVKTAALYLKIEDTETFAQVMRMDADKYV